MSVKKRVEKLIAETHKDDLKEVIISVYADREWHLSQETKDGETILISPNWTPEQIDDYVCIKIQGLSDNDMVWDDNDRPFSGWFPVNNHQHRDIQTIQYRSDRGHLVLLIIEWCNF